MNKKLKEIIFVVLGIFLVFFIVFLCIMKVTNNRYEEIKKSFAKALEWKFQATQPFGCAYTAGYENTDEVRSITTSKYLISQGYLKKEDMLDIFGNSYCKANAHVKCIDDKNVYEIYLKCKYYQDDGYVDW